MRKDNMPSFNIKMGFWLRLMFAWSDLVDALIRVVTFGLWSSGFSTWSRYKYTDYKIKQNRKRWEAKKEVLANDTTNYYEHGIMEK